VPAQLPAPSHWSLLVQATPSLQAAPALLLTAVQPPVPSQEDEVWQLLGVQV
jgi:hypothetical protein